MTTTTVQQITLPEVDLKFLKELAKKLGWTVKSAQKKKSAFEKSLDDIEAGRVYEAKDVDDLFQQCLG